MVIAVAAEITQARAVKDKLGERLASVSEVNGIGLMRHDGGWAVKVNLLLPVSGLAIPHRIDGVDVFTDVVGRIKAH
ncbi:hypothetical protein [Mycobacterium sp. SP-6446]|uniref:hypothetical protein n=1 Tax=Mycobacterium sp. SP-6446 TaxID=1834162 RepID=UPI0011158EA6|nr:hypothetical protein [Mycobacterium sp. SP-6446]